MKNGKTINQLRVGDSITKQVTESDVKGVAEISGDRNPIHLDAEFANHTIFKERIAHGILTASLIS